MAHLLAFGGGETGDVGDDRLGHVLLGPCGGVLFGESADLADHHDGLGVGVGFECLQRLQQRRADDRIAAGPEARGEPDVGQLAHELVGEGAGLGNQSKRTAPDDAVGDDAQVDAWVAEGDEAGAIRSDDAHAPGEREFDEIRGIGHWNAFGDDHDEFDAGFDCFDHGGLGELRRHEHHAGLGAGGFTGISAGGEHGDIGVGATLGTGEGDVHPGLARIHAADDIGAGLEHARRMGHALMAGHALDDDRSAVFDEQHQRTSLD